MHKSQSFRESICYKVQGCLLQPRLLNLKFAVTSCTAKWFQLYCCEFRCRLNAVGCERASMSIRAPARKAHTAIQVYGILKLTRKVSKVLLVLNAKPSLFPLILVSATKRDLSMLLGCMQSTNPHSLDPRILGTILTR